MTAEWYADGSSPEGSLLTIMDSGRVTSARLSDTQLTVLGQVPTDAAPHTVSLPGLGSYRAIADGSGSARLVVGLPTTDLDDTISSLIGWEVVMVLGAMILTGTIGAIVVRR